MREPFKSILQSISETESLFFELKNRFTVNIIAEPFVEAANYTCIDAPPDVDEWTLSGLTPLPSSYWEKDGGGPPRVGESPFSLECELYNHISITDDNGKQTGTIIIGRVRNYVLNEGEFHPSLACLVFFFLFILTFTSTRNSTRRWIS